MHYLLMYDVVPDYVERRAAFRDEHLSLAWDAHARGELVLGGALDEPVDGAVLLFRGDSPAAAEAFAARDPYVRNGLVTRWRVRTWKTVEGKSIRLPPGAYELRLKGGDGLRIVPEKVVLQRGEARTVAVVRPDLKPHLIGSPLSTQELRKMLEDEPKQPSP